jgi:MFS family permease
VSEPIVARTVQGLGAAAVLPLSLTILTTAFPLERRGMIVGVYGGLAGLAVALGPIVGGAITEAIELAVALLIAGFSANGHLGSPASVTADFRPALWAGVAFAVLAALTALGVSPRSAPPIDRRAAEAYAPERCPERIVGRCVEGPHDWIDTRITFALKPAEEVHRTGRT